VTLRKAQTILSISLLQHLKSPCKSFSQFETEYDKNMLLLKILHFPTCKQSSMILNTHSFKRLLLDEQLTWRDAAIVRIKLKVSATQCHHREHAARARWLIISQVPFLYGLPTYK
jgi:hypothetical protein